MKALDEWRNRWPSLEDAMKKWEEALKERPHKKEDRKEANSAPPVEKGLMRPRDLARFVIEWAKTYCKDVNDKQMREYCSHVAGWAARLWVRNGQQKNSWWESQGDWIRNELTSLQSQVIEEKRVASWEELFKFLKQVESLDDKKGGK